MKDRITPENITTLQENQIFIFGSNESGIHGAGAALIALEKFGAVYGVGFGPQSQTFAIPTKDWNVKTLRLEIIRFYVDRFLVYAKSEPNQTFLVTQIGCGLAGYMAEEIAPLFRYAIVLPNVHLPQSFWNILKQLEGETK